MKDFLEQTVQRRTGLCTLDPITLTGLALAGLGAAGGAGIAALASSGSSSSAAATPTAPPAPTEAAPPVQQPIGSQKSGAQGSTPSFVGSAAVPATGYGQKSLLGQ